MSGAPRATKHELELFLFDRPDKGCCEITKVSYGYRNGAILMEFSTEPGGKAVLNRINLNKIKLK